MASDRPGPLTRALSFVLFGVVVIGVGGLLVAIYRVATDSFVAPITLSPDSDVVLQTRLTLSQLLGERLRIVAQQDQVATSLKAADESIEHLKTLRATVTRALEWATALNTRHAKAGAGDLRVLDRQRATLAAMIERQSKIVAETEKNVRAGLTVQSDLTQEVQTLDKLRVAAIENERARIATESIVRDAILARKALTRSGDLAPTPEMLVQEEQLVKLELELVKTEAERRTKLSEKQRLDEALAKVDELLAQLKKRPIYRAMEAPTQLAFVPYTQMTGVAPGAEVYDCVWALFACRRVGRVTELVSGEVLAPDPWGTPTRGQYAVLELVDPRAAQSRFLRIRASRSSAPSAAPPPAVAAASER